MCLTFFEQIYQKTILIQLFLTVYFLCQMRFKPYLSSNQNKTECIYCAFIYFTLWLKIFNYTFPGEKKELKILFVFFEVLAQIFLIIFSLKKIMEYKFYSYLVQKKFLFLSKFLQQKQSDFFSLN